MTTAPLPVTVLVAVSGFARHILLDYEIAALLSRCDCLWQQALYWQSHHLLALRQWRLIP